MTAQRRGEGTGAQVMMTFGEITAIEIIGEKQRQTRLQMYVFIYSYTYIPIHMYVYVYEYLYTNT